MKRFILVIALAMASAAAASAQYINGSDSTNETTVISDGMKYRELKDIYNYKYFQHI